MRKLILLVSLLMMSALVFANEGAEKADESAGPAIEYLEMKPKFTVNLAEPKKYLLVDIRLLVEGAGAIEKIKKQMPALRHEMIMLLSGMHVADLQTMEQREALRAKTKQVITDTLNKTQSGEGFKDLFFSEFLIN
ncbi:MAG: flagellar basal body-associated FliL family protein [Methylomonas sp.]